MGTKKSAAVAYYRTTSAANVGADKDSQRRQAEIVESYASAATCWSSFYDAAVSGADPVDTRPGFGGLLAHVRRAPGRGGAGRECQPVRPRLDRPADRSRAAAGPRHRASAGGHSNALHRSVPYRGAGEADTWRGQSVREGRPRRQASPRTRRQAGSTGRCEGRKPVPVEVVAEARRFARKSPKTGSVAACEPSPPSWRPSDTSARQVARITRAASSECSLRPRPQATYRSPCLRLRRGTRLSNPVAASRSNVTSAAATKFRHSD